MGPKSVKYDILRQTAEQKLTNNSPHLNGKTLDNIKEILHELSVHQIELELQNESLKKTQMELEKSKEDYKELYDFAPVGYFTISESGFVKRVNLTGAKILGIERPLIINRAFVGFLSSDSIDIFHRTARRVLKKGEKASCELKVRRKDKSEFFGRLDCVGIRDTNSGPCENIIAILSDISKEKAAEAKIAKINEELEIKVQKRTVELKNALIAQHVSKVELQSIYLTAPIAIGLTHNMIIKSINSKMCDMLGFSKEELQNKHMKSLYEKKEDFENIHLNYDATNNIHSGEAQWLGKNGKKIDVLVCENSVAYKDDSLKKSIFTAMDITTRKKMENEKKNFEHKLQQTEKMQAIGQLAGGIAHDFNNQLCGISGYTELLKEEVSDNPLCLQYLNVIFKAIERTSNLTKQLLAYARKGNYLKVPIDIKDIILEVHSLLSLNINKKINVNIYQNTKQSNTIGDPNQLQNIILNIALNSCDAMPEGGILSFSTENVFLDQEWCTSSQNEIEPGNYIKISIRDTGIGMDVETQRHIFDPFFTTKEVGKGTGMGLAAVYGVVKDHKGAIEVTSQVGKGTTMEIFLPQQQHKIHGQIVHNKNTIFEKRIGSILLIDDEEIVSSVTNDYLKQKGFTVHVCNSGAQGVKFFASNWKEIDLVILDMIMPIMDGQETFKELKKINPQVKVLLSSGYSITDKARDLLKNGVHEFAQKPYKLNELHRQIVKML